MEQNIPEMVRNTAESMKALLLKLATHIEQVETENKQLKERNESRSDGNKG